MLYDIYKMHKTAVLIDGNGFAVDCVLKPDSSSEGYSLKGISHFTGATFDENGNGYFGDVVDITLNIDSVKEYTTLTPAHGWLIDLTYPNMQNCTVEFCIESVAIDRTLGMYLLKCSAATEAGGGKKFDRSGAGGI